MRLTVLCGILLASAAVMLGAHHSISRAQTTNEKQAPAAPKPRQLACKCILALSGLCGHVIGNIGGADIVTWMQDFYVPPGGVNPSMLKHACYRKRNADNHGNGLCCDQAMGAEDEVIDKLFKGELSPQRGAANTG
jgi:hypothetical protein